MRQSSAALAALFMVSVGTADEIDDGNRTPPDFADLIPRDAITNVEVFESNGFRMELSQNKELTADLEYTGEQFEGVVVTADNIFKVAVEKGRSMSTGGGVGIFHRATGTPLLSVGDQDGDGRLDVLTYTVVGEDGQAIRDVIDYEADGQSDLRIHFAEKYVEIWHQARWNRIENRDGQRGIVVDGEFKAVETVENRLLVK